MKNCTTLVFDVSIAQYEKDWRRILWSLEVLILVISESSRRLAIHVLYIAPVSDILEFGIIEFEVCVRWPEVECFTYWHIGGQIRSDSHLVSCGARCWTTNIHTLEVLLSPVDDGGTSTSSSLLSSLNIIKLQVFDVPDVSGFPVTAHSADGLSLDVPNFPVYPMYLLSDKL
jgi:hypothetical protein